MKFLGAATLNVTNRLSLRTALVLQSLVLIFLPLVLVGYIVQAKILQIVGNNIELTNLQALENLSARLEDFIDLTGTLAGQTLRARETIPDNKSAAKKVLEDLVELAPWIEALEVLDSSGRVVDSFPANLGTLGFDYSLQEFFTKLSDISPRN